MGAMTIAQPGPFCGFARRRAAFGALLALAATLGGCLAATPEVDVVAMRIAERTDHGVVIDVEIAGANRTRKDLRLRGMRYWLTLEGERVFEGRRSPQATFSALGVQSFTAPIAISADDVPASGAAEYEFGASITYVVPGPLAEAFFDLGLRRPSVRVQERGELRFPVAEDGS